MPSSFSASLRHAILAMCLILPATPAAMAQSAPDDAPHKVPAAGHKAFVLFEYQVKDRDLFKTLAAEVRETLKAYNGGLVMREKVQPFFGSNPTTLSVISFPGIEEARKWLASPELAKLRPDRDKAASFRTYIVEQLE